MSGMRRAVRMICGFREQTRKYEALESLPLSERLKKLHLFSLTKRSLRGSLITVYNYLNGEEISDIRRFFSHTEKGKRRSSALNLRSAKFRLEIWSKFVTLRIINFWNRLPFTSRLDIFPKDTASSCWSQPRNNQVKSVSCIIQEVRHNGPFWP